MHQIENSSKPKKKQSLFGEEQGPDTPIVMWKAVSAIENGHKAPISQIQWIAAVSASFLKCIFFAAPFEMHFRDLK